MLESLKKEMCDMAMKSSRFKPQVIFAMGDVHDCSLATVDDDVSVLTPLGSGGFT